jgi:hypothetical protein
MKTYVFDFSGRFCFVGAIEVPISPMSPIPNIAIEVWLRGFITWEE